MTIEAAFAIAAEIIESNGGTFDPVSSFACAGNVHAFSEESANGTSASGPKIWVDIDTVTGDIFVNNRTHNA
jgi:hypothetical protein